MRGVCLQRASDRAQRARVFSLLVVFSSLQESQLVLMLSIFSKLLGLSHYLLCAPPTTQTLPEALLFPRV